ncbi:MAG: M42 family metallopeptidase [Thermotogae bacterium]|nr:M42 family metallopeptidase [Thermotogota bacterium]
MNIEELREIVEIPGISGFEDQVREWIVSKIDLPYRVDPIGNLAYTIGEGEKEIVFMAHMDEIGLVVTGINADGTLNFRKVGGVDDKVLWGSHLIVVTPSRKLEGIIGPLPPHLSRQGVQSPTAERMVIDIGAKSAQKAAELGVKPITFAVFKKQFSVLNDKLVVSRALDDRFGCLALVELLRELKIDPPKRKVTVVFSVQEEIGLKGAKAYAARNELPDVVYAVDSFACCSQLTGEVKLGGGPVLRVFDNSAIASWNEVKHITTLADNLGIPLQMGVTGGGTDGSIFVEHGSLMVPITLAVRYLHSTVETISMDDYDNLVKLLKGIAYEEE